MDGESHWIARDYVTNEVQCLSVRVNVTNLRQGPGKNFALVERPVADRYTAFRRLDSKDEWYEVEDANGVKGWLHEDNVWRPTIVQNISF